MQRTSFFVKYFTLFLFAFSSTTLAANTMVNEYGVGINGVKSIFEINKKKDFKLMPLSIDFQKILRLNEEIKLNLNDTQNPLEILNPKVVIDDVVVFLDADMKMEGMVVYNGSTNLVSQAAYLPTYSPG